jgi:hypothetical protein
MANRYAVATGNWSNTATWDGGTLPQAGDVVRPNNFTVTIDQDITGVTLTNNASSPAVANGVFLITSATTRTLTCDLQGIAANGLGGVNSLLRLQSTGIINIIGNITNTGSSIGTQGGTVNIEANCTVNHTGNAIGGSNNVGYAVPHPAIRIISTCTFNGVGIYTGGSAWDANVPNSAIEVTNVVAAPIITIVGSVLAGTALFGPAITVRNSNTTVNINGIIQATALTIAVWITPPLAGYTTTNLRVSGSIINTSGSQAISSPRLILTNANSVSYLCQTENPLVNKTLYSADLLTGYPLVADVEDGVVYGPSSEFEGTLVPVNIDTAQLAADLLNEIAASPLPLAERLRNVATTSIVNSAVGSINVIP